MYSISLIKTAGQVTCGMTGPHPLSVARCPWPWQCRFPEDANKQISYIQDPTF